MTSVLLVPIGLGITYEVLHEAVLLLGARNGPRTEQEPMANVAAMLAEMAHIDVNHRTVHEFSSTEELRQIIRDALPELAEGADEWWAEDEEEEEGDEEGGDDEDEQEE